MSEEALRSALESMVYQFGYIGGGQISTGGMSALQDAFDALGWKDPHKAPKDLLCDAKGCGGEATCGTPTPSGYRRVCGKHYRDIDSVKENRVGQAISEDAG